MSEERGQWAVGLGYDFMFGVNVHDGLSVGEEVWVELHFCQSAGVQTVVQYFNAGMIGVFRVIEGVGKNSRLTTGIIFATFKTSSKS